MKKKWIILLYVLVILGVVGLLAHEYYTDGTLDHSSLTRCIIIVIGAVLGIIKVLTNRGRRGIAVNKEEVYNKAYGKIIGNAFTDMPKERKLFYAALDDFNNDKYSASVRKLLRLEKECCASSEQFPICHFLGWNMELLRDPYRALPYYERALRISINELTAQNIASCYQAMGNAEKELEYLEMSIRANPDYAIAHNNLGHYWIRMKKYEDAIPHLEKAHSLDANLANALSGLAICHAMMCNFEESEKAYHMAVALGYDGAKLNRFINSLEPPIEV